MPFLEKNELGHGWKTSKENNPICRRPTSLAIGVIGKRSNREQERSNKS